MNEFFVRTLGEIARIAETFNTSVIDLMKMPLSDLYILIPTMVNSWINLKTRTR